MSLPINAPMGIELQLLGNDFAEEIFGCCDFKWMLSDRAQSHWVIFCNKGPNRRSLRTDEVMLYHGAKLVKISGTVPKICKPTHAMDVIIKQAT